MEIYVSSYLDYFRRSAYSALFDAACMEKLDRVQQVYGDTKSSETILEVRLSEPEKTCDYSICIQTHKEFVREYWYELDADACDAKEIRPCYFVDASAVRAGGGSQVFYEQVLPRLAGSDRVQRLLPMLDKCVRALEGRCGSLFQIGVMTGRGAHDSIRIFTEDLRREDVTAYLSEIGWGGDCGALDRWLAELAQYSDKGQFIIDFDIEQTAVSDKIGINLGTRTKKPETVASWLSYLESKKLCLHEKKEGVLDFIRTFPQGEPFIQNDVSHYKLVFCGGDVTLAKAYLRQASVPYCSDFRAYFMPLLMNLELTQKCPLRCPQCYCTLSSGKDMDLQTALYWLDQAQKNGVRTVNLSGGETLCYPWLEEVIAACRQRGMEPNIAISGYGATPQRLGRLIACGVADICVSLNGSTKEINDRTRDGYDLAVDALMQLQKLGYDRTCINWVMHSVNADDFGALVALAERMGVRRVVVMVLKPDAANQRDSLPGEAQMRSVASIIKEYQLKEYSSQSNGGISIEVEECFSQMRALVGERFFMNLNRGISRGCGAGRDGFSVSVDGRLTPCRHLEIEETFDTLSSYWNQSQVLSRLRAVEDHMEEPCRGCSYRKNCLPCSAVGWKQSGEIVMGEQACPLKKPSAEEEIILVNLKDEETGSGEKMAVHRKGLLHRAFSVFLYHENRLLIQRRADQKYHSAGLWANTCCSHPRRGETLLDAVHRRLLEETGIDCAVRELDTFCYRADYGSLSEFEIDHIFIGEYDGAFVCNKEEASEMKYEDMDVILEDMQAHPQQYAAWFITAFPRVYQYLALNRRER